MSVTQLDAPLSAGGTSPPPRASEYRDTSLVSHRARARRAQGPSRQGLAKRRPAALAAYLASLILTAVVLMNPVQIIALLFLVTAALWMAGKLRDARPYLKTALLIGGVLAVLNPLLVPSGATTLWQTHLGPLTMAITLQGVVYGIATALRLGAVITTFALFSLVMEADEQLALMSRLSFRVGLVLSLAWRLLPVLSQDASRVSDAQRARGIELDAGPRRRRIARRAPLLAALLFRSLERALDVAASMEARGFGARHRSRWSHERPWRVADSVVVLSALIAVAALVGGLVAGSYDYTFYPLLDHPLGRRTLGWPAVLMAALSLPLAWTYSWRRSRR